MTGTSQGKRKPLYLLTATRAAQMLGTNVTTMRRWGVSGKVPVAAFAGTAPLFHPDDIETLRKELVAEAQQRAAALEATPLTA